MQFSVWYLARVSPFPAVVSLLQAILLIVWISGTPSHVSTRVPRCFHACSSCPVVRLFRRGSPRTRINERVNYQILVPGSKSPPGGSFSSILLAGATLVRQSSLQWLRGEEISDDGRALVPMCQHTVTPRLHRDIPPTPGPRTC